MDLTALLAELGDLAALATPETRSEALAAWSDEQIATARANIGAAVKLMGQGDLSAAVIAQMTEGKDAMGFLRAEAESRAAAAAEIVSAADAVLAELAAEEATTAQDGGTEEESGEGEAAPEGGDAPAEGEGDAPAEETAPEAAVEVVTAAAPARVAARQPAREVVVPARYAGRDEEGPSGPHLIASGSVRGVPTGHEFNSIEHAYRAIHDSWFALRGSADGVDHNIMQIDYRHLFTPEMTLGLDPWENSGKLQAWSDRFRRQQDSLAASGGVPGPAQPKYDLITYGTASRPIRDALPVFRAERGSVTWNVSPTIDDFVVDTSNAAINFATSATDVSGGSYKTVQEITAVTPATATVEAEYARLQHGNFSDRFLPELMAAWMKNLQVRYARHNDQRRLAEIQTGSTHYTDTPAVLGAYRDLKRQFLGITAEIEDHLRDPNLPMRVLMPEYVPSMLAADLIAQAPGDGVWNITEEAVRADMNSWDPSVNFTFFLDGSQTNQRLLTTPSGQSPRSPGFDADVDWFIFPEGTWAFLDGGTLDLGIVRDSTLNAQNRFQTFTETWETCAKFGPLSYRVTSSLCANGEAVVPTSSFKCSPQGS